MFLVPIWLKGILFNFKFYVLLNLFIVYTYRFLSLQFTLLVVNLTTGTG